MVHQGSRVGVLVAMCNQFRRQRQGGVIEALDNPKSTIQVRFPLLCLVMHHIHVLVVESAVTRLLVSIKDLLESLTQWSESNLDEEGVSDVYVRLGNDFNTAVHAFGLFNIEMS